MDHRQQSRRPGVPSKASDRDKAQALRDWIDAALAHYERQGGTRGIFVRKSPPPGEPPALADDPRLETEGCHDFTARIAE